MSKIGKKPISIPEKVEVKLTDGLVEVKGGLGELRVPVPSNLEVEVIDKIMKVIPRGTDRDTRAKWGLFRSLLANAIVGVSEGYEKRLELVGVGYRAQKKGAGIELAVGYSHPVEYQPMAGVELEVEKGEILIKGIDKQKVGQVAAEIRKVRPPEPYKGKGIRYVGEVVRLKPGKAAKAGI